MFWSYLALGVTLQLLSLLSLAGRLKRTAKRRRQEEEKEEEREEGGGWVNRERWCQEEGMMKGRR